LTATKVAKTFRQRIHEGPRYFERRGGAMRISRLIGIIGHGRLRGNFRLRAAKLRSVHAVAVTISGDMLPGMLLLPEARKKIAHPLNQEILAPGLIAKLQNHLPVIEIQGQARRHAIGKLARLLGAGGNPGLIVEQGMALLENLEERGLLLL